MEAKRREIYPSDAPAGATQREYDRFRRNSKRAARRASGRCPYCGRVPEAGRVRCERCLELQRKNMAAVRERSRAKREAERRATLPRQCPACGGAGLKKDGFQNGRQYYKCRDCGRHSYGDGPAPPPQNYPCPYCGGRCVKGGRALDVHRKPQLYICTSCGRRNTNLWPENAPSPGGPFPHRMRFCLNVPAHQALLLYCQEKKLSVPQAVRDIFIRAAKAPRLVASAGFRGYEFKSSLIRAYLQAHAALAAPLPAIPPGGVCFPSIHPEAVKKLNTLRVNGRFSPTVLVTLKITVCLNDLALASLLEMMRRRHLTHQDMARALIAETQQVRRSPVLGVARRSDLDGW